MEYNIDKIIDLLTEYGIDVNYTGRTNDNRRNREKIDINPLSIALETSHQK